MFLVQTLTHLPPVSARRRSSTRATVAGRHKGFHAVLLSSVTVVRLRIIAGVRHDSLRPNGGQGLIHQADEAIDVWVRPPTGSDAEDRMRVGIDTEFQLEKPRVAYGLLRCCPLAASPDEVAAGVAAVHAGRVKGSSSHPSATAEKPPHGGVEKPAGAGSSEQAYAGLLECGEMRNVRQAKNLTEVREVA